MKTILHMTPLLALLSTTACFDQVKTVSGNARLASELQAKLTPAAVLYVIARPAGETSGPPLAALRFPQPLKFPVAFTISSRDVMVPNTPFDGKITITGRIALSGSASPASAGDVEGIAEPDPIEVGSANVDLILDHVRP